MKARAHDPRRLDVERFAGDGQRLEGHWPLPGMARLAEACAAEDRPAATDRVRWQVFGERRRVGAGESHAWLNLSLDTQVKLTCQRCLGPVDTPLRFERWLHFVAGEDQAAALDAEAEEDVLATSRALDLHQLAEDELLLALPLVPRHEACPHPLPASRVELALEEAAEPNPFAVLAGLGRRAH